MIRALPPVGQPLIREENRTPLASGIDPNLKIYELQSRTISGCVLASNPAGPTKLARIEPFSF
jgi:hypothetical protein